MTDEAKTEIDALRRRVSEMESRLLMMGVALDAAKAAGETFVTLVGRLSLRMQEIERRLDHLN